MLNPQPNPNTFVTHFALPPSFLKYHLNQLKVVFLVRQLPCWSNKCSRPHKTILNRPAKPALCTLLTRILITKYNIFTGYNILLRICKLGFQTINYNDNCH